jgi:hypothetical protein
MAKSAIALFRVEQRFDAIMKIEVVMSSREQLHKLIDGLPDNEVSELLRYVEDLRANGEETLDAPTLAAIREGLDDIERGRVMDVQEYRRTRGL